MFNVLNLLRQKVRRRRTAIMDRYSRGGIVQLGVFRCNLLGPDGLPIRAWDIRNAATTAGLNHALDATFKGGAQELDWYLLLISAASYTTGPAVGDTMSSHSGWVENTTYSGVRPDWNRGTIAGGSLPNTAGTPSEFTFTGDTSLRGIGVTTDDTIGGTSGILWATAVEGSNRDVDNAQTLQVFYTNTFTPIS